MLFSSLVYIKSVESNYRDGPMAHKNMDDIAKGFVGGEDVLPLGMGNCCYQYLPFVFDKLRNEDPV